MRCGNTETQSFGGGKCDEFETPFEAWKLIFDKIGKDKMVWCPFYCEGSLTEHLNKLGVKFIHQDRDFYTYEPENYDIIVDNPPYSTKEKVFKKCIELNKPFALLVPLDTLERKYMSRLFNTDKLEIIIPKNRYNFKGGQNKKNCPFKSIWLCYKMGIGKQIIYE